MAERDTTLLRAALGYAEAMQWHVFPLAPKSKRPLKKGGHHTATTDEQAIRDWWTRWPRANIGIACSASGLVVIDIDVRGGAQGKVSWEALRAELGPEIGDTLTAQTPTGGLHLYYTAPDVQIRNSASKLGPGIDIRAAGGYIVAPPSIHPEGGIYKWAEADAPSQGLLATLPTGLALRILEATSRCQHVESRSTASAAVGEQIHQGSRNATLFSKAGGMRRQGLSEATIHAGLTIENQTCCVPPLSAAEVAHCVGSVMRYPASQEPEHLTNLGNARRLVAHTHDSLRHVPELGWLLWDGRRWARDNRDAAMRLACEIPELIRLEAVNSQNERQRAELFAWAHRSESLSQINAMVELARAQPELQARFSDLDRDPMLLNVLNGTLDLRTAELRPHHPDDLLTRLAPVEYRPGATHPVWTHYLDAVTGGDRELLGYLHRALGYSLTGCVDEEVLFLLLGPTNTGKTTLVETFLQMLGSGEGGYARKISFATLLESRHEGGAPRGDIAGLAGVRLAVASETQMSRRLDAVTVKELTGRDSITARHLYKEEFTFSPVAKLFLNTNEAPHMQDDDDALWRRARWLPFERVIAESDRDPQVKSILIQDLDARAAVLAWGVEGCTLWQHEGLGYPAVIRQKTATLRASFDPVSRFFDDCCVSGPQAETPAVELRRAYVQWAQQAGADLLNDREWSERLVGKGCVRQRRRDGGAKVTYWQGISLEQAMTG